MDIKRIKEFLDKIAPFTSGFGTFLGTYVLSISYPYYRGSFLDIYLGYFGIIIPALLAYLLCTCSCGREKNILFSWGSLGGIIGFFVGIPFMGPFQVLFASWIKGFTASTTIFTVIFSYIFHKYLPKFIKERCKL